jgi:hypothetical protein
MIVTATGGTLDKKMEELFIGDTGLAKSEEFYV